MPLPPRAKSSVGPLGKSRLNRLSKHQEVAGMLGGISETQAKHVLRRLILFGVEGPCWVRILEEYPCSFPGAESL